MTVSMTTDPSSAETPDLPRLDRVGRLARLRSGFDEAGIDALVVSDLANIRYLTGFTGSAAQVVVTADEVVFVTDGRYRFMATDQLAESGVEATLEVHQAVEQLEVIAKVCAGRRAGIEALQVSVARHETLLASLGTIVPTSGLVEKLRRTKDAGEVARIRGGAELAAEVFAGVVAGIGPETTELEIAVSMEASMRLSGADGPAFDTIVAAGPNAANAHAVPGPTAIGAMPVVVDFGATVDGYRSDTTRTIATGPVGSEIADAWAAVLAAHKAGVWMLRVGTPTHEIDRAARAKLAESGLEEHFTTGLGHGVGLVIHEDPFIRRTESTDRIRLGDIVTIEPGVYLRDRFGIRIEDMYWIAPGGPQRLSPAPFVPLTA